MTTTTTLPLKAEASMIYQIIPVWHYRRKKRKIERIQPAIDKLDAGFEMLKVNALTIPMMLYASYMTHKKDKDFVIEKKASKL